MKQMILVLMPVLFFIGALLTVNSGNNLEKPATTNQITGNSSNNSIAQQQILLPQANNLTNSIDTNQNSTTETSTSSQNPTKQVIYTTVRECSDGSGTVVYMVGNTTQIQPIQSKSAQCSDVVVVIKGGTKYFGCANGGKIILDCDWFAQESGNENFGNNTNFGNSYVEDFQSPDVSAFPCNETQIDQSLLLTPGGNICDLHNLVGNLNQMHS